jgi:RimJ/RimL family protein N-acetyltransferase
MEQIETSRLILRPFNALDAIDMAAVLGNPAVMQHIGRGHAKTFEETVDYLAYQLRHDAVYGYSLWAMVRKEDTRVIGQCGLWHLDGTGEVDLAYTLAQEFWGYGYATEASIAWLDYAFAPKIEPKIEQVEEPVAGLGLDRIVAIAKPENRASVRVLEKLGMRYERDGIFYGCHCWYYGLSRDQWNALRRGPRA